MERKSVEDMGDRTVPLAKSNSPGVIRRGPKFIMDHGGECFTPFPNPPRKVAEVVTGEVTCGGVSAFRSSLLGAECGGQCMGTGETLRSAD